MTNKSTASKEKPPLSNEEVIPVLPLGPQTHQCSRAFEPKLSPGRNLFTPSYPGILQEMGGPIEM